MDGRQELQEAPAAVRLARTEIDDPAMAELESTYVPDPWLVERQREPRDG